MSAIDRVEKLLSHYENEVGFKPDVIYMTNDFFDLISRSQMLSKFPSINSNEDPELFGTKVRIVKHLDGLDFQCFNSDHLNQLGDKYKNNPRFNDYHLELKVPRLKSTNASYIANGTPAPTINDVSLLKNIKIVVISEVLKDWVSH